MDDWNSAGGANSGKCIATNKLSKRPDNENNNKIGKSLGPELYRRSVLHTQYAYRATVIMMAPSALRTDDAPAERAVILMIAKLLGIIRSNDVLE